MPIAHSPIPINNCALNWLLIRSCQKSKTIPPSPKSAAGAKFGEGFCLKKISALMALKKTAIEKMTDSKPLFTYLTAV
ncbi:hypothetical protein D9M71_780840 [compost metagenome]